MSAGEVGLGIVPLTDDPDTGGFFAAAREGRLVVQECVSCGNLQQPPRHRCITCLATDLTWHDLPKRGTIHSWTVVEHQINPNFPAPYTVLLVDVEDEASTVPLRFLGRIVGREEPELGAAVELVFETVGDAVLPNWRLVEG
ncbi:Zn-ribbon domain-containing OB-fold protein [Nocardioides alcanivorans]|uniref:Zn-ribbon domain-containing OB-fold protein n=1 Tax=Nocardioides alcanivorans TaxID=2897352 RepID=UPI001F17EEDF|nr:OB-fold domain-containing protein [Nocardioides alcanivorans]